MKNRKRDWKLEPELESLRGKYDSLLLIGIKGHRADSVIESAGRQDLVVAIADLMERSDDACDLFFKAIEFYLEYQKDNKENEKL